MPVPLTYAAVGATRSGEPVAGYRALAREARLGQGRALFERAGSSVLEWGIQRGAGMRVNAGSPVPVEVGDEARIRITVLGPVAITIPARVVYVVRDDRVRGFAYGTLPGHPESGEEAFLVEHRDDDSVWLVIRAFSRPSSWFWRLGSPVLRFYQELYTRRYLRALR